MNRSPLFFSALVVLPLALGCSDELGSEPLTAALDDSGDLFNHEPSRGGTGTATVEPVSGRVVIEVAGLPKLGEDERYEGWLAFGDEPPISTGVFNTDDTGAGRSEKVLGDVSAASYTRVEITVEPYPDPDPAPAPIHSIGGDL